MREKELRIALICYGGVSLAVYMHGVTKETWHLARAANEAASGAPPSRGVESAYRRLLDAMAKKGDTRLRVVPDILAGASAGGLNAIFLGEALLTGRSLDPLTRLWLDCADSDVLVAPEARPGNRFSKLWAQPLVEWALRRPGNAVTRTVAPETREEVRGKLSRLIRSRWFAPPFSGIGMARLIDDALVAMLRQEPGPSLIPDGHPVDLFVTATDFRGSNMPLRLHSPAMARETEHRLPISFRAHGGDPVMAPRPDLVFAARATSSFPGAFPPLTVAEIEALATERGQNWDSREEFLHRVMPHHVHAGDIGNVALIDGAVLVGAPFAEAIAALSGRPATREVDRRFIYIDPRPDFRMGHGNPGEPNREIGFFSAIFGALSAIPREQPIRDDLERIADHSREAARLRAIVDALRPEVEATVDRLLGRTLFLDRPTPERLTKWRRRAQQAAAENAGFAFHSYARSKYAGIIENLAGLIRRAHPGDKPSRESIASTLSGFLEHHGLASLSGGKTGASEEAISFFRTHDLGFRIRRLRLLARRLSPGDIGGALPAEKRNAARDAVYEALSIYTRLDGVEALGPGFPPVASRIFSDPEAALAHIAATRDLAETDPKVDALLADGLSPLPREQRRVLLLAYLGFPFYDIATLPLLGARGFDEFEPIKVDRISPEDASAIRGGGAAESLKGIEFYNFGAFFSRAYRENDYLWGRLHGAERLIDITASTLEPESALPAGLMADIRREAFLAILAEEDEAGQCSAHLIEALRREVMEGPAKRE
ncbi:patatin-like protein [Croceicoccus mobilis]|uniref:PNPLA domain-containing protein n=1 Tax=Croceicoccus mobilis TaxID=1703339 RepID=A0A917DRU0_9SPHN|nr:patatin-like protein [Croceicoccus mobilis]GGD64957.1 hypothetical protein GCM10010990_13040 [Croceicoccus mobilis]